MSNNLNSRQQHGFLLAGSTLTNSFDCLNEWTTVVTKKWGWRVTYIDMAKASDTVSHSKFLHKLHCLGTGGRKFLM